MSKEPNLVEARRDSKVRDYVREQYIRAKDRGCLEQEGVKQPDDLILFILGRLEETGLSRGKETDSKLIKEEIAALEKEANPTYVEPQDAHLFVSTEDETKLREQLTTDLVLPRKIILKIRDINKISRGIKIGPLVIKRPRRQMDEELIARLTEYGVKACIERALELLEDGGFKPEDKPATVLALKNAMNHAASGIEHLINTREEMFQGRELVDNAGRRTTLIDQEGISKNHYEGAVKDMTPAKIDEQFFNIGLASADFSLGHANVIADFIMIVNLRKRIYEEDVEFLNEIIIPLRAKVEHEELEKLDHALAGLGLVYMEEESCYKLMPYLEPKD